VQVFRQSGMANAREAVVTDVAIHAVCSLAEAVGILSGALPAEPVTAGVQKLFAGRTPHLLHGSYCANLRRMTRSLALLDFACRRWGAWYAGDVDTHCQVGAVRKRGNPGWQRASQGFFLPPARLLAGSLPRRLRRRGWKPPPLRRTHLCKRQVPSAFLVEDRACRPA
jgi:hypothetical protein